MTAVRLRIGVLSGIEPELLERAFTLARAGTVAADADLVFTTAPATIACRTCGHRAETAVSRLTCPRCGGFDVAVVGGDDLILESVDLEIASDAERDVPRAEVAWHV